MKAYVWGNNQVVTVAENKKDAVKNAIARTKDYPDLVKTIVNTDPIEIPELKTRILWTEWAVS